MIDAPVEQFAGASVLEAATVLHVGCGGEALPDWLPPLGREVRLDIDPQHNPDIVASMTDMGDIGPFDSIFCSHSLEHLYPHDAALALTEFYRVLRPGGVAFIIVPDVEGVEASEAVLYESLAGPVTGLDLYYGMRRLLHIMPHMAHRNAFTATTLRTALEGAGFTGVHAVRAGSWSLVGAGQRP